jgi:hypothetical protein
MNMKTNNSFLKWFSLHAALRSNMFQLLLEMIQNGGDIHIKNIYQETVLEMSKKSSLTISDFDVEETFKKAMESEKALKMKKTSVWKELPMIKCIRKENLNLLCFLNLIGGQWGAVDKSGTRTLTFLSDFLDNNQDILLNGNWFVHWTILNANDQVIFSNLLRTRSILS